MAIERIKEGNNINIKEWYLKKYPHDDLGQEIDPNVTFEDLFEALDTYEDVYEVLGGNEIDSIVRERCFEKLSEIMDEIGRAHV